MTAQFRAAADEWRDIYGMSDAAAADLIRQDKIDILVDLAMHMAANRLLLFARKPAPVQVTFGAYPGSTGLATMDWRLTDPYLDPPGADEEVYSARYACPALIGATTQNRWAWPMSPSQARCRRWRRDMSLLAA
jgi:protein O-GlcNAc transferase